jgi:hypothetical protein
VTSSIVWEQLPHTNLATSWILSLDLTMLDKLSLPYAKSLCHLNIALQPKASLLYASLIIWNVSLVDLPNFGRSWCFSVAQNVTFLTFVTWQQLYFTTMTLLLNTPCARNCFFLEEEKNRHGTISWPHVFTVVHNSAIMWPMYKTDFTLYKYK